MTFDNTWESALSQQACKICLLHGSSHLSHQVTPFQKIGEVNILGQGIQGLFCGPTSPPPLVGLNCLKKLEVMKTSNYLQLKADFPHFTTKENIQWELWWFYDIDPPSSQLHIQYEMDFHRIVLLSYLEASY